MRCIAPIRLKSGDIVPCGKCNFCLLTRRIDWSFRLAQELKVATSAKFVTMTYSDEKLRIKDGIPVLDKRDVQLFLKRLRKACSELDKALKIRYYVVGEYGENTERPHYHMLLFNVPLVLYPALHLFWYEDKVPIGQILIGEVTGASIYYTCKYHVNPLGRRDGRAPPFALMSRRPGIGSNYLKSHRSWHRRGMRNFTQVNGVVSRLPRFYKEKFFSNIERMKMAIESVRLGDDLYLDEIERLSKFHSSPFEHFEERMQAMCDKISMKSKLTKF